MTPRAYRLGRRQATVDRTHARVLAGARKLLKSRDAAKGFSIDAVAQHAGVTRATIYHHFKSKTGLLSSVYDNLAARAGLRERLGSAFRERDPRAGLRKLIAAFCHFWASDRLVIRRLHALADLDATFSRADRGEWRRDAIREMQNRLGTKRDGLGLNDLVDALHTLTSFETFDALAYGARNGKAVANLIDVLAARLLAA